MAWFVHLTDLLVDLGHPFVETESESGLQMLDDLSRQSIELNLFAATFHEAIINFSHPFGQGQFRTLFEEICAVQFSMQLVHKVGASEAELVQEFTQPSSCDVKPSSRQAIRY